MIRRMLHGMPTKPVLVIAPLIMTVVLTAYYFDKHNDCTHGATLREQLYARLQQNIGKTIPLTDIVPLQWNQATILAGYKPEANAKLPDCPFEWGWTKTYRESLVARNSLNIIVFAEDGKPVDYVEFSRDRIDFTDIDNPYKPETAVFEVKVPGSKTGRLLLKPATAVNR